MEITCYSCLTLKECETCGQEVEEEGVTYNLDDFPYERQARAVYDHICPECGSHRTEMV